jgi:hypothetical protein
MYKLALEIDSKKYPLLYSIVEYSSAPYYYKIRVVLVRS